MPEIKEEAKRISKEKYVIIDAPLLFETGLDKICDITIGVIAGKETCIKRICARDGVSTEIAEARINNQNKNSFFKIKCNYCINNETGENLEKQINEILTGKNLSNENVIHLYDKDIEYLQFRKLLEYEDKIKHCYTLKPLDFKRGAGKKIENEYKKIGSALEINTEKIYRPKQTHTNNVRKVSEEGNHDKLFVDVDGLVTDKRGKILSLTFADCICLYFYDPVKNVIGCIHSGWRGTYRKIAKTAVETLKREYNVEPKDLICRNSAKYKRLLL